MKEIDISGLTVQVWAAHQHHWEKGRSFRHLPANHQNPLVQYHLWLIREGTVEVLSSGRTWRIESGDAFFLPVTLPRDIRTPEPTSWLSIGLRVTIFNRFNFLENLQLPVSWRVSIDERSKLEGWMEQIVQERLHPEPHRRLMVLGLGSAVFGLCWPHLSSEPLDSSPHAELPLWLVKVLRYISQNPDCNIADLAHNAGFSPAQFRRIFHKWVGVPPRDYLKKRRMETAQHLLATTDLSLRTIATRVGLGDASYFSELFKATYDISPSDYRAAFHSKQL